MSILFEGLLLMGFALLLFGVIDIPYQRWEHLKELRMTKQELKEEFKTTKVALKSNNVFDKFNNSLLVVKSTKWCQLQT